MLDISLTLAGFPFLFDYWIPFTTHAGCFTFLRFRCATFLAFSRFESLRLTVERRSAHELKILSPSQQHLHYLWQYEFFRKQVRHVYITPFLFPSSFSNKHTRAVRPWSYLAKLFHFNLYFHFEQPLLFLFDV